MSKRKPVKPAPAHRPVQKKHAGRSSPLTSHTSIRGGWLVGLLAPALGFLLYANTLGHDYCLDDLSGITENWVVKGGLKNIGIIFSTEYRYGSLNSPDSLYRPVPLALFAWQWQMSPNNPHVAHLFNVLLYALTGWLLWGTWRRILANYPPALTAVAVLVFIAHPVHTEVVANIKSVDEILALLFCTWSLYSIWRYCEPGHKRSWLALAVVSYSLGLLSKESAITFLAVFPLVIWFFTEKTVTQNLRISALMLFPAALFLFVRQNVIGSQAALSGQFSVLDNFIVGAANQSERLASAFMMCWRYLQTLILPHPLISDLGYPQMTVVSFGDWRAVLGLLLYTGMGAWALVNLKRKHFLAFAVLFYLATFSLFSNIVMTIGTSYGERLLYVPSLGFAFALGYLSCHILKITDLSHAWTPNGKGAALWGVVGILIATYSVKTISRNPAWLDSGTLFAADIMSSPNGAKLNYNLGIALEKKGISDADGIVTDETWVLKGIDTYSKAIQLYPKYHDAYGSRGLAYASLQQYDQAFRDYQEALKYRPGDAMVLANMGFTYWRRNQLDEAESVYRQSIESNPRFVEARRNLGALLAMKRDFPAAIEQWEEALKYDPTNVTLLTYIGSAYRDMGQPEKGEPYVQRAGQAGGK